MIFEEYFHMKNYIKLKKYENEELSNEISHMSNRRAYTLY